MGSKYTYHTNLGQMREEPRNVVLAIDGTWNDPTDAQDEGGGTTNVLRLHDAISRDANQFVRYFPGVGNEEQNGRLGQLFGGAFGRGADQIRDEAYAVLVTNYRPGDRLFLFGFSRGAAIARMLANTIHEEGIPDRITISKDDDGRITKYKARGGRRKIDIEMLGVWDTVAAFGIPVNLFGIPFQSINLFRDFTIAPNIHRAYHLLSVDENRDAFTPSLMNHEPDRIEEIWFPGVHSDVGGGYDKRRLADIGLAHMIDRATKHGLQFHEPSLAELAPNPTGLGVLHYHRERVGDYKMGPREIGVSDDDDLSKELQPRLHTSVLRRMEAVPDYKPESVLALEGRYQVVET